MPRFCGRTLPPGLKRQMVTTIRGIECGMGNGDLFCALWFFGHGKKEETILDIQRVVTERTKTNVVRSPCYKANSVKLCGRKSR